VLLQELMKLMGLPNWMHWLCWFLDGTFSASVSIFITVLLLCVEWDPNVGRVIFYSNGFLVYLFFLLYAMSLVVFLFAFSTLFSSRQFNCILKFC
jgi:ATP-binding cassette subfamily A (ABC1) protein 3